MESAPAQAHRGTRTVLTVLTILGYVHSLAAFGAAYIIVHDAADSRASLWPTSRPRRWTHDRHSLRGRNHRDRLDSRDRRKHGRGLTAPLGVRLAARPEVLELVSESA
jgi:hypothetical protein